MTQRLEGIAAEPMDEDHIGLAPLALANGDLMQFAQNWLLKSSRFRQEYVNFAK